MLVRLALVIASAMVGPGCYTVRVAAGPIVTTEGGVGADLSVKVGFGLGVETGVTFWPENGEFKPHVAGSFELPGGRIGGGMIGAGIRAGVRPSPERTAGMFGVAVYYLPWYRVDSPNVCLHHINAVGGELLAMKLFGDDEADPTWGSARFAFIYEHMRLNDLFAKTCPKSAAAPTITP